MTRSEFERWAARGGYVLGKDGRWDTMTRTVVIGMVGTVSHRFRLLKGRVYKEQLGTKGWQHQWGAPYEKLNVDRKNRLRFERMRI